MTPRPGRRILPTDRRLIPTRVSAPFVVAVACLQALRPGGPITVLYTAMMIVFILVIGAGPLLRGVRPAPAWTVVLVGSGCFLAGLLTTGVSVSYGPMSLSNALYVIGYLCYCVWVVVLVRFMGRRAAVRAVIDTVTATTGAFLSFWTVAHVESAPQAPTVLSWAIFPILDVLALALATHLVFRTGRLVLSWWWLVAGFGLQLVLDTVWALNGLLRAGQVPDLPWYILSYYLLAQAATDPSIAVLTRPWHPVQRQGSTRLRSGLVVAGVVLAVGCVLAPVDSPTDSLIRSATVALLALLLGARLLVALADLSQAEAENSERAAHDDLTGLLNRAALLDALRHRLSRRDSPASVALLFLDCDDFKMINDTWGHPAGDRLLRSVAAGLPRAVRSEDVVARHGGDEFVVVADVADEVEARMLAERVHRFFADPLEILPGRTLRVTPSIGVAVAAPSAGITPTTLLGRADVALYEAKRLGRDRFVMYDADLDARTRDRTHMAEALQTAIRQERIGVAFQPIFRGPGSVEIAGWEALARWEDPRHGSPPPSVFVPVAEEMGLIPELGELVLRQALGDFAALATPGMFVSVNVASRQLRRAGFGTSVLEAVAEAGLAPECLWLEITETLLADTHPQVAETIRSLRAAGVVICLDDYGTGQATLSTLLHLPVDAVKLDRSLVARLGSDPEAADQVRALVRLLRSLRVRHLVAAGIETVQQDAALRLVGAPMVQGLLYGPPQPPSQFERAAGPAQTRTGQRSAMGAVGGGGPQMPTPPVDE